MTERSRSEIGKANRRAGRELERAAQLQLERRGWFVLKVGSGQGGVVDLVAIGGELDHGMTLLVQCKSNGYVPPADRAALAELALRHGIWVSVATWHKEGRAARTVAFKPLEA